LVRSTDAKEAAKTICATPALLAEARDRLAVVTRLAKPIGKQDLYVALQPLIIMYGTPEFGDDETGVEIGATWIDLYLNALKDHPREAIDIAVSECIRLRKYNDFPKPGYLNELAQQTTDEIRLVAFRLRLAVERAEQHRPAPKRTEEETREIKEIISDLKGPDGRIHLGAKSVQSVTPKTDRQATAEALRKMADYR
jgi:hypothetical protein